jgi:O-antigen/teichoic acid export membrane protein
MDPFAIYQSYLQGKKLFSVSARSFMLSQLVALLLIGATLLITTNTAALILAYFIAWAGSNFFFYRRTLRRHTPNTAIDPKTLSYGRHLSSMEILSAIAGQLDKVLAFQLLGPAQLAIYSFAVAIPDQLKGPIKSINSLAMPKFAGQTDEQTRSSIRTKFPFLIIGSTIVTVGYIVCAPFIYHILFPQYQESIIYSQLFGISLLNSAVFPLGTYLSAKARIKDQYILNISGSVFQIISMIAFTMWYGLLGLILARVITRFFGSIVNYLLYIRKSPTEATI